MTRERWQKIDKILDEALELSPTEREKFLTQKCGKDKDLRLEIQSLLSAFDEADEFIEDSAIRVVAKNLAGKKVQTSNFFGKSIDSYKIEKLIGEGGMSQVFLAFDEKLKREVAVKILQSQYAAGDERVSRFRREASVISALNHPNIVTIYDVGNIDGVNYIATEFVEGKTLREFVGGEMNLRKILNVIIQCCDALAAAHNAGIIHRDIKPENIIVRPDGYVKILDFGLAKLTKDSLIDSDDFTKTVQGAIIGTPAYMSPEQISGEQVDHRTDLWSIGLVLYELVTGTNPFKKESKQQAFQAVLGNETPPASSENPEVPFELDRALFKALEKKRVLRYQTASDLKADLMRIKRDMDSSASQSGYPSAVRAKSARHSLYFGLAILCVLVILPVAGFVWYFNFSSEQQAEGFDWTKAQNVRLTSQAGTEYFPSLAPDGESFVFAAENQGNYDIFLQRIGGKMAVNLTENSAEDDTQPAFSPDGRQIAFRSDRGGGGIFVMEPTGENPRRISDFGFHPSWSPSGDQIAVSEKGFVRPVTADRSSLWIVDVKSGERQKLIGDRVYQPAWSPSGERIAFWFVGSDHGKRSIATVSVQGGEQTIVSDAANTEFNPVWSPDGKFLYFASDRGGNVAFWRVRIDESTGKTLSQAEIVPTPAKFNSHLAFSKDGKRLIYVQINTQSNLKAVKFDSKQKKMKGEPYPVTQGDYEIRRPRISPDGKHFIFDFDRQIYEDIAVIDRDGKNWRDLTNDKHFDRYPVWSADGENIAFLSDRSGNLEIWMINPDGSNLRQITSNPKAKLFPIWAPDSPRFAYRLDGEHFIFNFEDSGKYTQKKLPAVKGFRYTDWDWSPDGKKIAGRWRNPDDDTSGIGYFSLEKNGYEKLWTGDSTMPRWMPDSRHLIFSYRGNLSFMDINLPEPREILSLSQETISGVGISRDGNLVYFTARFTESNIWMLDLKQP